MYQKSYIVSSSHTNYKFKETTIILIKICNYIFTGAFFDKADANGYSLSDYMSFGSVTATCLVIIVNAQVVFTRSTLTFVLTKLNKRSRIDLPIFNADELYFRLH